jgi:hypothetical protein
MGKFQREVLHRRNYCDAHLLVCGHCVRGVVATCRHGSLLLCSLLQGKFCQVSHLWIIMVRLSPAIAPSWEYLERNYES